MWAGKVHEGQMKRVLRLLQTVLFFEGLVMRRTEVGVW